MFLGKNPGKKTARKRCYPNDNTVKGQAVNHEPVHAKRFAKMQPQENTAKNKPFREIKNTHIRFDGKSGNESTKNIQKTSKIPLNSKVEKNTPEKLSATSDRTIKQAKASNCKNVLSGIHDENVCNTSAKSISKDSRTTSSPQGGNTKKRTNKHKKKPVHAIADITHKSTTGDSNWSRFLKEQNIEPKTPAKAHVSPKPDNKSNKNTKLSSNSKKTTPDNKILVHPEPKLTKVVGLDCEMVGVGDNGKEHMLARASIVNSRGECLYDKFVKPKEPVVDYRTYVSGVRPEDIANGEDFETVQRDVATILKNRILVGHSLKNDLAVLHLSHPRWAIRDTSKYFRERGKGTPGLKKLALENLGVTIQEGEHSSVQDAQAAVQLYNMYRGPWEAGGGNKKVNRIRTDKRTPKPVVLSCA